jgi:hypothetical protein
MEARHRLVKVSAGSLALIALTLFVLVTLDSLPRTTRPSTLVAPTVVTSPEQPAK